MRGQAIDVRAGFNSSNRISRSGTVHYGSVHNGYGDAHPVHYGGGNGHSVLGVQIRHNQPRPGGNVHYVNGEVYGGLRYGYVGYNRHWRDDFFLYPYYAFNPYGGFGVVASPWYGYSFLPPYLDTSRVVVVDNYGPAYDPDDHWQDYNNRSDRNRDLDHALDDIQDAFERNNDRTAERLLPPAGQVGIFNQGKYDYSISAADFRDMFLDGVEESVTVRYEITETRIRGNEVHLRARHDYTDSWGANQSVFHTYTLRRESGGYVIREFGTE